MQSAIGIDLTIGTKCFHHRLIIRLAVHTFFHDLTALCKGRVKIAPGILLVSHQITVIVCPHRAKRTPVVLRVYEQFIVLCRVKIQHRRQYLIVHLHARQHQIRRLFCLSSNDRHRISHKPYTSVQKQPVIGAGLRIRLSGRRKPLLRYILIGIDSHCPRHGHRFFRFNIRNECMGVGTAKELYHQTVLWRDVIRIHRLSGHKLHGIQLADRLCHYLIFLLTELTHDAPPSCSIRSARFRSALFL